MSGRIEISVIIPTYRRGESLARCVESVLAQGSVRFEILIVDQNPAGSLERSLPRSSSDLRILRQEEPNVSKARNAGFASSKGARVFFVDDDVIVPAGFFEEAMSLLDSNPDVVCMAPVILTDHVRRPEDDPFRRLRCGRHPTSSRLWRLRWTISAAVLFSREGFRASGGFDEFLFRHGRAAEDFELFSRMGLRGLAVWSADGLTVYHDEGVPGGAEMRTVDRPAQTKRQFRAMSLIARRRSVRCPKLNISQAVSLWRNTVVHRRMLSSGPRRLLADVRALLSAMAWSRSLLESDGAPAWVSPLEIDFLTDHTGPVEGRRSPGDPRDGE